MSIAETGAEPKKTRHGVHREEYHNEYSRRRLSMLANVAPIPKVVDRARRERCAASLLDFVLEYCGNLFERAPSAKLCDYALQMQAAIEGAGQIHVRMARGGGKTTLVKGVLAWGLVTGRLHYAVVFAASAQLAAAIVADVWGVFESGGAFAEDWPEVAWPIAQAGGLSQRFAAQHWNGQRTMMRKSRFEIVLPTLPGSACSGGVLVARGAGSKTRGLVRGKRRPDFVLLDDLQSREDAANAERIAKLSAWIDGDVQGLAGSRMLNAVMTSTPIVAGDLSEQYADPAAHPEWKLVEYRLLDGEPEHPDLWAEYAALWKSARQSGDMGFRDATAFYRSHRAEMDAGLDVLDPGNFDARLELSGIQHAQNLRLIMGDEAFRAEYQLEVRAAVGTLQITPALVASRLNGSLRGTMPPGTLQCVAFCDVNATVGISWACVAFGPRGVASVVDYGRYPGGGRRLVPEGVTEAETQRLIAAGLSETLRRLLDSTVPTADGVQERIAAVWVDAGWQRRVVQRVVTVFRQRTGRLVWASTGMAHDRYNPHGRHVIQRGDGVDHRALDGDRWFTHDADRWRERAQRAWLGEPMQSGTLSLPGSNAREHADFAAEICAENLAEKITDVRGMEHYFWTSRPGAGNHWLDAVTGCMAMGAWYRLLDDTAEAVNAIPAGSAAQSFTPAPAGPSRPQRAARRRVQRTFSPRML